MIRERLITAYLMCLAATALLSSCSKPEDPKTVYLALETHSEEQKQLNQDIAHELSRKMHSGDFVIVDQMTGDSVVNLISNERPAKVLKEIETEIEISPSSDLAVIEAVKRASSIADRTDNKVQCVIVTKGVADNYSVGELSYALSDLPSSVSISIIGIDPENRLPMSQAFSAVPGQVRFGSLDSEWRDLIHRVTK